MGTTAPPLIARMRYRHEAVLWRGTDALLASTVPFITEAIAEGAPIMVAVTEQTWEPIRGALGSDARRVRHVDMTRLGANPARIVPAWLDFAAEGSGAPSFGIAEPVWSGRRPVEVAECHLHEAALNLAIPAHTPMWLLCTYDADALGEECLTEARRTHPIVADDGHPEVSNDYRGPGHRRALGARPLPEPPTRPARRRFRRGDLCEVRRFVIQHARAAGLSPDRCDDLALAVNELAANSLDHGGGRGTVRAWRDRDALVIEVSDSGTIHDPLAGQIHPGTDQQRGRGLWIVNHLCDVLQVRSDRRGTTARAVTWLPPGS